MSNVSYRSEYISYDVPSRQVGNVLMLKADGTVWKWPGDDYSFGHSTQIPYRSNILMLKSHVDLVDFDEALIRLDETIIELGSTESLETLNQVYHYNKDTGGLKHSLSIDDDGVLHSWGQNSNGELGIGGTSDFELRRELNITGVMSVAAGDTHSIALTSTGDVYSWGGNQFGQLGVEAYNLVPSFRETSPVRLSIEDAVYVDAGSEFSLALMRDGTLKSWGRNQLGQLGLGHFDGVNQPTDLNITHVKGVAAGARHVVALRTDGSVWCWGDNQYGQLANTTQDNISTIPHRVVIGDERFDNNIKAIAAGSRHTVVLTADGNVWTWGDNSSGQLGIYPSNNTQQPTKVFISDVKAIAAGALHTLALKSDGTLWAWGNNSYGQLGTGVTGVASSQVTPRKINGTFNTITQISAGSFNTYIRDKDGKMWMWGLNDTHQLGTADTTDRAEAVVLEDDFYTRKSYNKPLENIVTAAPGNGFSVALQADGSVWTWGDESDGRLGRLLEIPPTTPGKLNLETIIDIGAGDDFAVALDYKGQLWEWGALSRGSAASTIFNTDVNSSLPIRVPIDGVKSFSIGALHTLALLKDGTVFSWGDNTHYQLGMGTTDSAMQAGTVKYLKNIISVAAGQQHSLALTSDGRVFSWGNNEMGQLGFENLGATRQYTSPVIMNITDVVAIAAGKDHSLALKSDGSLWGWGGNTAGQLVPHHS